MKVKISGVEEDVSIQDENRRLAGQIIDYERKINDRVGKIDKTIEEAEKSLNEIKGMAKAAYVFGFVFLVISIILFIVQVVLSLQGIEWAEQLQNGALGLGAIGIVDLIGLMLYKPMDRIQKATSDFAQLSMVSNNYAMATKLIMLGTTFTNDNGETYEHESIMKAVNSLNNLMTISIKAIQQYTEEAVSSGTG